MKCLELKCLKSAKYSNEWIAGFPSFGSIDAWVILCGGGHPRHGRMWTSASPPHTGHHNKKESGSRRCKMSSEGANLSLDQNH